MISIHVYFVKIILFLSIIFTTIFSWLSVDNNYQLQKTDYKSMVRIQRLLNTISTECRYGEFEYAQNSYLDLHLEWQRIEVSSGKTEAGRSYSSDRLTILGQMIDKAAEMPQKNGYKDSIICEIQRITGQLDLQSIR